MNATRDPFSCLTLLDSADAVDLDPRTGAVRVEFDGGRDSAALAVVAAVATALGREPLELPSLYASVDTDSLETLATRDDREKRGAASVSFEYCGFDVTATADGDVEAVPTYSPPQDV